MESSPSTSRTLYVTGDSASLSPLHAKYPWVDDTILSTKSLMSASDLSRLDLGDVACCTLRSPSDEEPVCAVREGVDNSFFFFNRDYTTRLGVRFPFTEFQMEVLNYLHLAPTQLHPNGWGFILAFEKFCNRLPEPIPCKCSIFFYFFCPFTPIADKDRDIYGITSLRSVVGRKLFTPFSDSFKRFKTSFFKVAAVSGQQPWFLFGPESKDVEWRFPLYWTKDHHKKESTSYQIDGDDLPAEDVVFVSRLVTFVKEHGVQSVSSILFPPASTAGAGPSRTMEPLPPYLTVVNQDDDAPQAAPPRRRTRKRRAADPSKGKGPATSSAPSPKRARAPVSGGSLIPSSTVPPQLERPSPVLVEDLTEGVEAGEQVEPPSPPPPSFRLPRGFLWEQGCSSDELSVAFLPPRRFQDLHLALTEADERAIHHAQDELVKGVGFLQSLLLLKRMVVTSSAEKHRIEAARDAADAARKKAEGELEAAKATATRAEVELKAMEAEVSKKSAALSSAQEGLKSSQEP